MAQYSIKDLEKLSGIQAHTIRIWEKRYKLVTPQRTSTNIRIYSDEDLKRLLNVAVLNHNGLKISKIAKLEDSDMNERIMQLSGDASNVDSQVEGLIVAMVELNEAKFEEVLNQQVDQLGFEDAIVNIVYPFLVKIGVLWQTGNVNPAQEHFVTNIVRKKLFSAIDSLGNANNGAKVILFLPEGEFHEISLLFYTYLIKKLGLNPIYLGQSVPIEDLISIQNSYNAEFLFTSFVTTLHDISLSEYISKLSKSFKKQKVFVTGNLVLNLEIKRATNIIKVKTPEHFKEQLMKMK
jgi:DNA-binding transcriptional MerR regulator